MSKILPWFRMYSDFIYDEKVEFLSFEDQRHYVFILCMKNLGLLDKEYPKDGMLDRVVAKRLGLYGEAFEAAKSRLIDSGLINESFQPIAWEKRQFRGDSDPTAADRKRRQRERERQQAGESGVPDESRVTVTDVTRTDTDTDADTDAETPKALAPDGAQDNPPEPPAGDTKPEKTAKGKPAADPPPMTIDDLVDEGVERQHASDWLKVRRAKKAPLTPTAWAGLKAEAEKAGITPAEAVRIAAGESWQGFKAAWHARMQQEERNRGSGSRDANGKTVAATSQQRSFKGVQYKQGRVDPLFEDLEEAANL